MSDGKKDEENFFGVYGSLGSTTFDVKGAVLTPEIIQEAFDSVIKCRWCGLVDKKNGTVYEAFRRYFINPCKEYPTGVYIDDYYGKVICDECFAKGVHEK